MTGPGRDAHRALRRTLLVDVLAAVLLVALVISTGALS